VGELSNSQSHLNSDKGCEYVEVSCTNMCGEKMKRKYLNEHTATASYANTSASIVDTRTPIMPLLQSVAQKVIVMNMTLATTRLVRTIPRSV